MLYCVCHDFLGFQCYVVFLGVSCVVLNLFSLFRAISLCVCHVCLFLCQPGCVMNFVDVATSTPMVLSTLCEPAPPHPNPRLPIPRHLTSSSTPKVTTATILNMDQIQFSQNSSSIPASSNLPGFREQNMNIRSYFFHRPKLRRVEGRRL